MKMFPNICADKSRCYSADQGWDREMKSHYNLQIQKHFVGYVLLNRTGDGVPVDILLACIALVFVFAMHDNGKVFRESTRLKTYLSLMSKSIVWDHRTPSHAVLSRDKLEFFRSICTVSPSIPLNLALTYSSWWNSFGHIFACRYWWRRRILQNSFPFLRACEFRTRREINFIRLSDRLQWIIEESIIHTTCPFGPVPSN